MTTNNKYVLMNSLKTFIPNKELSEIFELSRAQRRLRKLDLKKLFFVLLLAYSSGNERKIVGFKRVYEAETGITMRGSSFYEHLNENLALALKEILARISNRMCFPVNRLKKILRFLQDLVLIDSTFITLHDKLKDVYVASGRNSGNKPAQAQLKLQLAMSANANAPIQINLTSGKEHEGKTLQIGDWVTGKLILMDRGYYSHSLFKEIHDRGGYFISRLLWSVNPMIVGDNLPLHIFCPPSIPEKFAGLRKMWTLHSSSSGVFTLSIMPAFLGAGLNMCKPQSPVGRRFTEVLKNESQRELDVDVSICRHKAVSKQVMCIFRIVSLWNPAEKKYHSYITNIPPELLSAGEVGRVYRLRWEIEMIFKELKSHFRIDQINTKNKNIVEIFVYISLISLILSRYVLNNLRSSYNLAASKTPERRFTIVFSTIAMKILHDLISLTENRKKWAEHENFLLKEMIGEKRKRQLNLNIIRN